MVDTARKAIMKTRGEYCVTNPPMRVDQCASYASVPQENLLKLSRRADAPFTTGAQWLLSKTSDPAPCKFFARV